MAKAVKNALEFFRQKQPKVFNFSVDVFSLIYYRSTFYFVRMDTMSFCVILIRINLEQILNSILKELWRRRWKKIYYKNSSDRSDRLRLKNWVMYFCLNSILKGLWNTRWKKLTIKIFSIAVIDRLRKIEYVFLPKLNVEGAWEWMKKIYDKHFWCMAGIMNRIWKIR